MTNELNGIFMMANLPGNANRTKIVPKVCTWDGNLQTLAKFPECVLELIILADAGIRQAGHGVRCGVWTPSSRLTRLITDKINGFNVKRLICWLLQQTLAMTILATSSAVCSHTDCDGWRISGAFPFSLCQSFTKTCQDHCQSGICFSSGGPCGHQVRRPTNQFNYE